MQLALLQSGSALRASQLQLQALSSRVEELQGQLESECEAVVAQLAVAHELHEAAMEDMQVGWK